MIRLDRFRPRLRSYRPRKLLGQKPPLKLKDIWAIRIRLQLSGRLRDLALFNLAIDSKLRGCDLVALRVHDVFHSGQVTVRAITMQQKTGRPVQFEITEQTRVATRLLVPSQKVAFERPTQTKRNVRFKLLADKSDARILNRTTHAQCMALTFADVRDR